MRRAELLGFTAAALTLLGCETIAGLGDFGPEPTPTGGAGGVGGTGVGGAGGTGVGGTGGRGGSGFDQPAASYSRSFGSSAADTFGGLDTGTTDVLIAGTHLGDIELDQVLVHSGGVNHFVAGLSAFLEPNWSRSFACDGNGLLGWLSVGGARVSIVGWVTDAIGFGGTTLTPQAPSDAYWAQLNSQSGSHVNSAMAPTPNAQHAWAVAAHGGGAVAGGLYLADVDFGGLSQPLSADGKDGYVVRYRNDGVAMWAARITGTDQQEVRALAIDAASDIVYVAGIHQAEGTAGYVTTCAVPHHATTGDNWDSFIVALDLASGSCLGVASFESADHVVARGLAHRDDGLVFVGTFEGTVDFGAGPHESLGSDDGFVARFLPATAGAGGIGDCDWSQRYGAAGRDRAFATDVDAAGNVVVVGDFEQTVDFGAGPQTARSKDVFVLKLDDQGEHLWSGAYGSPQDDSALRVAVDDESNIIVGGEFSDRLTFGNEPLVSNGSTDLFVAKFPPNPTR
ncbi:MAG: hypothetical protein JRI23_15715 [Deltaproteobacteria bacterium]|jgi:hypothetical protein|nr:hypothetical protein [Deltaproteobacteria bacterium]MBW2533208.1 hypothetical protein [Deltaproteobacteria bacterium]